MSIIENDYRLPFISFPAAVKLRNNKSARIHAEFVDQAVLELPNSDRVRMVNEQPFVVNPLSVSVQPCGKKRLKKNNILFIVEVHLAMQASSQALHLNP